MTTETEQKTPIFGAGIDLGGTKIEAQVFDQNWQIIERKRMPTPREYGDLIQALAEQTEWIRALTGSRINVGISVPGATDATGRFSAPNLCAKGKPFEADLLRALGSGIAFINDARAFTLSEAVLGAGKDADYVLGVTLGTGLGGGYCAHGQLINSGAGITGEFGHLPLPARYIDRHKLDLLPCGCGQKGCIETYLCGAGLARIASALGVQDATPEAVVEHRADDPRCAAAWKTWCELGGELLAALIVVVNADMVVLGGGLSRVPGVAEDMAAQLARTTPYGNFGLPKVRTAQGGDASGARGAAYLAWRNAQA